MDIKIRKKAFTLAEVLITIAIIGVVAALVVPNIVNSKIHLSELAKDTIISKCKNTGTMKNPKYPGAWIMYNSWSIPDDYPYEL